MSLGEEKHGVVFFDPNRGFIQVRNKYFVLKRALEYNPDLKLETGHFAHCLGDAKNNIPSEGVTPRMLETLINIEEVGLMNIHQVYQEKDGKWWCHTTEYCPTCGRRL